MSLKFFDEMIKITVHMERFWVMWRAWSSRWHFTPFPPVSVGSCM